MNEKAKKKNYLLNYLLFWSNLIIKIKHFSFFILNLQIKAKYNIITKLINIF